MEHLETIVEEKKKESGQGLVELAITLIVLIFMLGWLVEVGRMMFIMVSLHDAAKEGAVFASFCPPASPLDALAISHHVQKSSHYPLNLEDDNKVTVNAGMLFLCQNTKVPPPCDASDPNDVPVPQVGSTVTVAVEYGPYEFWMPFVSDIAQATVGDISLRAEAEDVAIQFNCPE
jgi:hypothetical protein